jgi:hypothetical protein
VKLFLNIRARLFKGKPQRSEFTLSRRDDLHTRTRRIMEYLNIDANHRDMIELQIRLGKAIERYMELDNCPDIRPRAGLW